MNQNTDGHDQRADDCSMITFPTLLISGGFVYLVDSLKLESNQLAIKQGFFQGMILIDIHGCKFEVTGVRKIRRLLSSADLVFRFLTGNAKWLMELVVAPSPLQLSSTQVKSLVSSTFRREKYFWSEMTDFDEFRKELGAATSLQEIFAVFSKWLSARP